MQGFWKTLPMATFMLAVSIFQMYTTGAQAQTVGNMPATDSVHVCDSGTSCDDVPTIPAERQLKGLTDFIKSLLGPLEGRVADLETLVSSLMTRVTTLEGDVATLQGQQAAAPTQSQITALQQQITQLQATVTALQAGGPGDAKAWWGRIGNSGSTSYNFTQTMTGNNMVLTFGTPRPDADYAVNLTFLSPENCYVFSRTAVAVTISCSTSAHSAVKSVTIYDN